MHEELFSITELTEITNEAINPIYSEPNLIHLGTNKTSIRGVSGANGLILAYGNAHTGYQHIYERHSQSSRMPFWDESGKIGKPTKFPLNFAPVDYLYVASTIYKETNICLKKNKRPETFELYIGTYHHKKGRSVEYSLLVYKNSKVIHTFFINENSKPFNQKRHVNLKQSWVTGNHTLFENIQTFTFSYYDNSDIELFKVLIRYDGNVKKERWYVQVNPISDRPFVTTHLKEVDVVKSDQYMINLFSYEFDDVSWIEKIIKTMLLGTYKY